MPDHAIPPSALRPQVTLTLRGREILAEWPPIDVAYAYHVEVRDAGGTMVCETDVSAASYAPPVSLPFTAVSGETYYVEVSVRGMPSERRDVTVPTPSAILQALRDRLLAARVPGPGDDTYTYPLDERVLPDGVDGDPGRVRELLAAVFGATGDESGSPAITMTAEPVLILGGPEPETLVITGVSTALTGYDAETTVEFTVSDEIALEATCTVVPPGGWNLSEVFGAFIESPFVYLPLRDPSFVVTTFPHTVPGVFFPLTEGLQFQGTLLVRGDLLPLRGEDAEEIEEAEEGVWAVRVGGPIDLTDSGPRFSWGSEGTLGSLSVARVGGAALTVTDGRVTLGSAPTDDPSARLDTLLIEGQVELDGTFMDCVVDLPTVVTPVLTLRVPDPGVLTGSTEAVLAACGVDDVLGPRLPSALLDLTGVRMTGYTVVFAPDGGEPTQTTVTLGFGSGTWPLVPTLGLFVSDLAADLTVIYAPGFPQPWVHYGGEVRGTLGIGGSAYTVRMALPGDGLWYVEVATAPPLTALAALAGLGSEQVTGVLPGALTGQAITPGRVALLIEPTAGELREISFALAQTRPWSLGGGLLTLSDWTAELSISRTASGWNTSGAITGTVALTAGDTTTALRLRAAVPIKDNLWTLSLAEDTTVHIPTIGQILQLFGGSPVALPTGLSTLGGLEVTHFTVSFDPAGATLAHVGFVCAQSGDWTIIDGALTVTDLSVALSLVPGSGVTGYLTGLLTLAGTPVDVYMLRNDPEEGWRLLAGYNEPVHVPGFAALDAWLAPDVVPEGLPAALPLASGFSVGDVFVDFTVDGAVERFGFTVHTPNAWTVIPGSLALTEVDAHLTLPYPVRADAVTGSVSAVVTLGGAEIGVSASKPVVDAPWEFTGTLLYGLTVDLLKAVSELASGLGLPADAVSYGLPATIRIRSAEVRAVPDTGAFHFAGSAAFDWEFGFGAATFAIRSIGGVIDVPEREAPVTAAITGVFEFAGIRAAVTLALGEADTVITGRLAPADVPDVHLPGLADGIVTGMSWTEVVPTDLAELSFGDAALYLNLTQSRFLVYGGLAYGDRTAADALAYFGPDAFAVALALGPDFRFGQLLTALSVIDEVLCVTDARLVICHLPEGTLGELAVATTAMLAAADPAATSPLAGLDSAAHALSTGVYLTARIDFAPVTLFSRILQIGDDATPPAVEVFALIDREDSTRTVFAAALPDITIFQAIRLTGVRLAYTPAAADRFDLAGRMILSGIFGSDLAFDVTLTVDDHGLTSTVEPTSQAINPFGLPGITLSDLALVVSYTWAVPPDIPRRSRYSLRGHVLLGPEPAPGESDERISCAGALELRDGTPVLAHVELDRDWSIGGFLAQCLTGAGSNWPAHFIDVTFLAGTRIYYYASADDPGGTLATLDNRVYAEGFNVDAHIRLTLLTDITLHAVVNVRRDPDTGDYTSVRAGIQLDNPIDLIFVQLAGNTQPAAGLPYTGGPLLAFETGTTPRFVLETGINFLGSAFLAVNVSVSRTGDGGTRFAGQLTAPRPLEPFGVLSCGFAYTTHPGREGEFEITGWPEFTWARQLIDFVAAIRNLCDTSIGSICGQLSSLILSEAYDSSFSISPSVSASGDNLIFTLTGTYSLTISGADEPFLTVDLPPFSVAVPKTTRWEDLPGVLAEGFADASAHVVRDLLARPDKAALFLAMLFGPSAVELALELACNDLVDGAVAAAAGAGASAISAAGGPAAAGVAGAALTAIIASLVASAEDRDEEDEEDEEDDTGDEGTVTPAVPVFRSLVYSNGAVVGAWDAARNASGYEFELLRPDGSSLATRVLGYTLTDAIPLDAETLPAGTYRGRVRSLRGAAASGWATREIVKPAAPPVTLEYDGAVLTARWTDSGADGYTVGFTAPDGNPFAEVTVPGTVREYSIDLPDPLPGEYHARVKAERVGHIPGAWGTAEPVVIMDRVTDVEASYDHVAEEVTVTWAAIEPPGFGYEVTLVPPGDGDGLVVRVPPEPSAPATASFDVGELPGAVICQVRVRTIGEDSFGAWSSPVPVALIDPPSDQDASYDGVSLTVTWTQVPGATGYRFTLASPDGTPVITETVDASVTHLLLPATELTPEVPYIGTVVSLLEAYLSPEPAPGLTIVPVAAPTGVTAAFVKSRLRVSWQPVTGATGYTVEVTPLGGTAATTDTAETSLVLEGYVPGISHLVRVRAVGQPSAPRVLSVWSDDVPVVQSDFTVLCLGAPLGGDCHGAVAEPHGTVFLGIPKTRLDSDFLPDQKSHGTGWVGVRPGPAGPLGAVLQLVIRLATMEKLSPEEAFEVFAPGTGQIIEASDGGDMVCMCLGASPGGDCRGDVTGQYGDIVHGVSKTEVDKHFEPTREPRTGWVAVTDEPYTPLLVLSRLVMLLFTKEYLTEAESYHVFNATMTINVRGGDGGTKACVALGAPIGGPCRTGGGKSGDVALDMSPEQVARLRPGVESGWAVVEQTPSMALSALLRLVTLLARKEILTGAEPYEVFTPKLPG